METGKLDDRTVLDRLGRLLSGMPASNCPEVNEAQVFRLAAGEVWTNGGPPDPAGCYTLLQLRRGHGVLTVQADAEHLREGACAMTGPDIPLRLECRASSGAELVVIQAGLAGCREEADIRRPVIRLTFTPGRLQLYDQLFQTVLRHANETAHPMRKLLAQASLIQLMGEMYGTVNHRLHRAQRPDERILHVKRTMDKNPEQPLKIGELAEETGISEKYFSALFKQQLGVSPKEYQSRIRFDYAARLLETTGMSVKEVAHRLGYLDPYTFSRQFKQRHGYPPSRLRGRRRPRPD